MQLCSMPKLRLKSADLTNAYFTADPIDRLLLLRPPKCGQPGEEGRYALARQKPIHGTKDAGRRFYKTLRRRAIEAGLKESRLCRSFNTCRVDGRVVMMVGAHVDDILWAGEPEYEYIMTDLFKCFELNGIDEGDFRFCCREYSQKGRLQRVCHTQQH